MKSGTMKYLKTYEKAQDFYTTKEPLYLIISEDEKWYVKASKGQIHSSSNMEKNDDFGYAIFPMEELDNGISMNILFSNKWGKLTQTMLKILNSLEEKFEEDEEFISITKEYYDKYGKDLEVNPPSKLYHLEHDEEHVRGMENGKILSYFVTGLKFKSVRYYVGLQKAGNLNL